jgi:hypothetical protein
MEAFEVYRAVVPVWSAYLQISVRGIVSTDRLDAAPRNRSVFVLCAALSIAFATPANAGPPYLSDDPEPTDYQHYEIYTLSNGTATRDGISGEGGIDFNYGGAPNLQLTATLPIGYNLPAEGSLVGGFGNVELAAKYRFLTQDTVGLDVAFFPRVILPSASSLVGEQHTSFLFPIWVQKDWGNWSAFGGGGCEINRGGASQDFCEGGVVLTRKMSSNLQVGLELFHQTPAARGGPATTSLGTGVIYDLNEHFHLLGYIGRGIQNADETDRFNWYASVLFTFGGPLRVLCLSTEDGLNEMALRLRAAMTHYQLTDADVPGLYFIGADRWGLPLLHAEGNRAVLDRPGMDALTAELDQIKPDVLIIDPLINVMGGVDANGNAAAALLMGQLTTLATTRRISVALAHHTSKGRDPR